MCAFAVRRYLNLLVTLIAFTSVAFPSSKFQGTALDSEDEKAIKSTIEAYRKAWLANESKGVLQTFTSNAVLLPAHGAPAVVGIDAIEKYWFTPGGPPVTIDRLDITFDQISGTGELAFVRGLDGVAWTIAQDGVTHHHSHSGTYLNVMKKQLDGSWRIQVHMWDDGPERVD